MSSLMEIKDELSERLEFLASSFEIFDKEEALKVEPEVIKFKKFGSEVIKHNDTILAFKIVSPIEDATEKYPKGKRVFRGEKVSTKIRISDSVFADMVLADPTENKQFLKWMINVFVRLIKEGEIHEAINFATEDLEMANEYLKLFEANKRKKKFKEFCNKTHALKHIEDPSDLYQYKNLSQVFNAIDPFIERTVSDLERTMERFVEVGNGEIVFKDRLWTVFIPYDTDAACIAHKIAGWCTATPGNGMFRSYTEQKTPAGNKSKLYIVFNNKLFKGESRELYQLHFESGQLMDYSNRNADSDFYNNVIRSSEGLDAYFKEELSKLAREENSSTGESKYINFLVKFGHTESLFEFIPEESLRINKRNQFIPSIPDMSKFQKLEAIVISGAKLDVVHPSLFKLPNLEMISLTDGNLTSLPIEIKYAKRVMLLNITGNKIVTIPDEIAELDKSNGGRLNVLIVNSDEIGDTNFKKLHDLLPNVGIEDAKLKQ